MRILISLGIGIALLAAGAWWMMRPATEQPAAVVTPGVASVEVAPGFALPADSTQNSPVPNDATPAALKPARTAPAGYTEYRNLQYRFALFYPSNFSVKVYDEGGGASTVTFQNTATAQGFQIFIVPYGGAQVSESQFKKDEPSGVMQEPTNVTVDGTFGTMFFGSQPPLGDTREVWFIKNGYLFEVSAPKSLDSWLQGIMGSFEFI